MVADLAQVRPQQGRARSPASVILCFYLVGIFAEFLAPALPSAARPQYTYAPPQGIAFFVTGEDGRREWLPHVKGYSVEVDPVALRRTFVVDDSKVIPIGFFVRGPEYKMWGLFKTDLHFFGPLNKNDPIYLLGTDRLGRDLLSRLIYGTRVSMSIGLIGVAMSLTIGVVLGSLSGFYGGWVDIAIQRLIEIVSAMPTIPLWLGLAAAVPLTWSPLKVYFVITLIVSLLGLDRPRARGARPLLRAARRGLRHRRAARRLERAAGDLPPHPAVADEPHPRGGDARDPDDDRRRDRAVLPRRRPEAARRLLRRAAAGRPEHPHRRDRARGC